MIKNLIAYVFAQTGFTWNTKTGRIVPDEEDIQIVLDEAAKALYTGVVGDRFESAGLIIEKRGSGFDTWVFVGNYK